MAVRSKGQRCILAATREQSPILRRDPAKLIAIFQMSEQLSSFSEFYKKKHSNRVLNWDHALGNASVIGNFKGGKKELLVSLYQAIVLLQFNENTGGTGYNEIKMVTGIRKSHSVSDEATTINRVAMPYDQSQPM